MKIGTEEAKLEQLKIPSIPEIFPGVDSFQIEECQLQLLDAG
jgi:hypothetical protein